MKIIRTILCAAFLLQATGVYASMGNKSGHDAFSFDQDLILTTPYKILTVSSYNDRDFIMAYSYYGTRSWELDFTAKILSWKIKDGNLFVLSKKHDGRTNFLTSINPETGKVNWEKALD